MRFTSNLPIDAKFHGFSLVGAAGTILSVPDALWDEVQAELQAHTLTAVDTSGGVPISTLTAAATIAETDLFIVDSAGVSKSVAPDTVSAYFRAADVTGTGTVEEVIVAMRNSGLMTATPATLVFDEEPTAADYDVVISPAATVQVTDDLDNLCVFDNTTDVTVELTTPGDGVLGGTLTQTAVAGVATFDDLYVNTEAGTYTLTASSGTLATDESAEFDITDPEA